MTKEAMEVLVQMKDGVEFAYENGVGYLGHRRVKKATKILEELFRYMAIRKVSTPGCSTEYYRIGPEGVNLLLDKPDTP